MTYSTYGQGTCFWSSPPHPAECRVQFVYPTPDTWTMLESCEGHLENYLASDERNLLDESPIRATIYHFYVPWAEWRELA